MIVFKVEYTCNSMSNRPLCTLVTVQNINNTAAFLKRKENKNLYVTHLCTEYIYSKFQMNQSNSLIEKDPKKILITAAILEREGNKSLHINRSNFLPSNFISNFITIGKGVWP